MMKPLVLTDIEGTTSSISFVKDVLFPYARRALPDFVQAHGARAEVRHWLDAVAAETGAADAAALTATLQGWMDEDRKHTALKALQGMMWQAGYERGDFRAHIYPDAARALQQWHADGLALAVYSSGSVPAQKLFFGHSEAGNLLPLFAAFFDTETGHKRDAASYSRIAAALARPAAGILFLSDVVEELDAARDAGMRTVLLDRREDYPSPRTGAACNGHSRVESFAAITP